MKVFKVFAVTMVLAYSLLAGMIDISMCKYSYSVGNKMDISLTDTENEKCFQMNITQYIKVDFDESWSGDSVVNGRILDRYGDMIGYTNKAYYLAPGSMLFIHTAT